MEPRAFLDSVANDGAAAFGRSKWKLGRLGIPIAWAGGTGRYEDNGIAVLSERLIGLAYRVVHEAVHIKLEVLSRE
jgi:hypothetical protein